MIIAKIDVTKLDKAHFFKGTKGIYADLVLIPNKDGVDQYGNDGFVSQGVSKEAREKGEKGVIVGNYKKVNRGSDAKPEPKPTAKQFSFLNLFLVHVLGKVTCRR
jgi:hypothetical protein